MMKRLLQIVRRMRRSAPCPGNEGFSLVEILMVLMILTVGIIPLAVVQHHARKEVQESNSYTLSLNVAQSQLERLKGMGFGNAAADSGVVDNVQWRAQVVNVSFGLDRITVTAGIPGAGASDIAVSGLVSMR